MHFCVGVIIPNQDDVRNSVDSLLAPYDEAIEGNEEAHWDWYEVGGRWDGILKGKNAKPNTVSTKYDVKDNIIKVSDFLELAGIGDKLQESIHKMLNEPSIMPYAIVSEEDGWAEGDGYIENSKEWEKEATEILKRNKDKYLVCVDCHC